MRTGKVKFFDPRRGYGFITPDDGGVDVFLQLDCVKRCGATALVAGASVQFEAGRRERGEYVTTIAAPGASPASGEPAKVKWFSRSKGFGFVTTASGVDVFVTAAALRASGVTHLDAGRTVTVSFVARDRGAFATGIFADA